MARIAKKRRTNASIAGNGRKSRDLPARRSRRNPNALQRLILGLGETLLGVLPRSRRTRAANDPEA